jgi:hypothetical protein
MDFKEEESLLSVTELSDLFSDVAPTKGHLHIVARSPPAGESHWLIVIAMLI